MLWFRLLLSLSIFSFGAIVAGGEDGTATARLPSPSSSGRLAQVSGAARSAASATASAAGSAWRALPQGVQTKAITTGQKVASAGLVGLYGWGMLGAGYNFFRRFRFKSGALKRVLKTSKVELATLLTGTALGLWYLLWYKGTPGGRVNPLSLGTDPYNFAAQHWAGPAGADPQRVRQSQLQGAGVLGLGAAFAVSALLSTLKNSTLGKLVFG